MTAAALNLPPKASRYNSLDMWRGVACLLMIVFHTTMQVTAAYQYYDPGQEPLERSGQKLVMLTARTWVGVPIFFVISGYCIMATLDSARRKQRGLGDYVLRRVRRIYPPYWIAIALSVLAIGAVEALGYEGLFADGRFTVPRPWELTLGQWIGNLTLTETWRPLLDPAPMANLLPNTWTLCYEEQFYLLAGLVLWAAPRRLFLAMGLFTVATMVVKVIAHKLGVQLFGTFLDGRWLILSAGILVYYRVNYAGRWTGHLINAALLAGLLTSHLGPARMLDWEPTKDLERFVAYGFALFLSLAHGWDAAIMRTPIARAFAWVGGFSYSIYLMHPLVTKGVSYGLFRSGVDDPWMTLLVIVPSCVVASLIVSRLFYLLVERRFSNPVEAVKPTAGRLPVIEAVDISPSRQQDMAHRFSVAHAPSTGESIPTSPVMFEHSTFLPVVTTHV